MAEVIDFCYNYAWVNVISAIIISIFKASKIYGAGFRVFEHMYMKKATDTTEDHPWTQRSQSYETLHEQLGTTNTASKTQKKATENKQNCDWNDNVEGNGKDTLGLHGSGNVSLANTTTTATATCSLTMTLIFKDKRKCKPCR